MLLISSKKDINYIPYECSLESRIDFPELLKFDFNQTLLIYRGISFVVKLGNTITGYKCGDDFFTEQYPGKFEQVEQVFKNNESGEMETIEYVIITLDPELSPEEFRDVIFFHELQEMF